jgi:hypothetical protein
MSLKQKSVFLVTSNSAVSASAFNLTTGEITLAVSGPSRGKGQVNVEIPKNVIADPSKLQIFVDSARTNYSVQQQPYLWIISLNYPHGSHQIVMDLSLVTTNPIVSAILSQELFVGIMIVAILSFSISVLFALVKRKRAP